MPLCILRRYITNDLQFFTQLTSLLKACHTKDHGSVLLSQKRLTHGTLPTETAHDGTKIGDNPLWDLNPPNPLPIIVRASNAKCPKTRKAGGKKKITTIVQPDDLEGFYMRYAEVCKRGMEALRKRDRSKKKKDKKKVKKEGEAT
jgi:signal recognition particle subunit SRP14